MTRVELPKWFNGHVYEEGDTVTISVNGHSYERTAEEPSQRQSPQTLRHLVYEGSVSMNLRGTSQRPLGTGTTDNQARRDAKR